ncbi:cell division protein FtsQ/DivIB [Imhoffiella purpurea]|uniref:Cell division protein FtsQ n=1 Tax=Imhoffiella purpurea TaxID=1249627 RepID=W9VET4_9GAMM|nr:cell division protein FtsQ/DivIB [Imhoffiella purpurea]EXJ15496.1 Cell division protein FtsQ [Imhoffiella purpurea]
MKTTRPVESRSASEPSAWRARLLALLGLTLFGATASAVWLFGYWEPRLLPILVIEVQGELHHHSSELLQQTISERLHGGILTADLADLKSAAEALPWVGHASLRRVWPDRLQVRVEEHRPLARWNGDGLVTADGIVFHPLSRTIPAGLPLLEGDDKRAPEVAKRYQRWRDDLMLVGHLIQSLSVDPRGDWRVGLVMGTELRLGTGSVDERLARFISSAQQLEAAGRPLVVDLRYSNGFAVKWAPDASPQARANSDRSKRSGNRG